MSHRHFIFGLVYLIMHSAGSRLSPQGASINPQHRNNQSTLAQTEKSWSIRVWVNPSQMKQPDCSLSCFHYMYVVASIDRMRRHYFRLDEEGHRWRYLTPAFHMTLSNAAVFMIISISQTGHQQDPTFHWQKLRKPSSTRITITPGTIGNFEQFLKCGK